MFHSGTPVKAETNGSDIELSAVLETLARHPLGVREYSH
jgi:hypothetical protein